MGIVSVLLAALGGFVAGAVWYMTLAKPWAEAAGFTFDENGKPQGNGSKMPFLVAGICVVLVSGMMRHIFSMAGLDGAGAGLIAGLGIGLFFIAPWLAMNYAYAMRPAKLTLIDGGYAVVGCGVIGFLLGIL